MQQISIHMHATEESMLSFNPSPGTFHKAQDTERVLLAGPHGDWYELKAVKLAAEINARKAEGNEAEMKDELEAYAKEHHGVDLDKRKSLKDLQLEVEDLNAKAEQAKEGSEQPSDQKPQDEQITEASQPSGPQPKAKK